MFFINKNFLVLNIIFFLYLPSGLYFYFNVPLSLGTIFTIAYFILVYLKCRIYYISLKVFKGFNLIYFILALFLLHTLISFYCYEDINKLKSLASVGYFFLIFFTSFYLILFLIEIDEYQLYKAIKKLFYFMYFLGLLSIFLNYLEVVNPKSMIIFKEPSHYSLYFIPIILIKCYTLQEKNKLLTLSATFILAILLQSLVLIVGIILISFICIRLKKIIYLFIILTTIVTLGSIFLDIDNYILNRINLFVQEANTKNLSSMVYLSGWERMFLGLINTMWFGVGINNFGIIESGYYGNEVIKFVGYLLNYNDGSFLLAKFVGEFGLIGLILMIIYGYFFISYSYKYKKNEIKNFNDLFFISLFLSFFIYILFRGQGYFNTLTLLFYSSVIYLMYSDDFIMKVKN